MGPSTQYLAFVGVSLMIAVSPGPSWAYAISTTLRGGRISGFAGIVGNSAGILMHAAAATLGLSAIVATSATAFSVLKYAGAAYLFYLGIASFRGRGPLRTGQQSRSNATQRSKRSAFLGGMLVNVLNPKVSLLFIALMPQFILTPVSSVPGSGAGAGVDAGVGAGLGADTVAAQVAVMGLTHAVIALIVLTNVVFLAEAIGRRLEGPTRFTRVVRATLGCVFVAFAVRLALATRP